MIASLPMYDRDETAGANDRLWDLIRSAPGVGAFDPPERLLREGDLWNHWRHPDLLLSQTCGLPYAAHLREQVALVCSPVYDFADLPPGHYRSIFVVRRQDAARPLDAFADRRLAINDRFSQSGWGAPFNHAAGLGFRFGKVLETGAHRYSVQAIAEGRADIAAIDILTWRMIRRWDAAAADLVEIGATVPTPAPPYITARPAASTALSAALEAGIEALDTADREALGLRGVVQVPAGAYAAVAVPPTPPLMADPA